LGNTYGSYALCVILNTSVISPRNRLYFGIGSFKCVSLCLSGIYNGSTNCDGPPIDTGQCINHMLADVTGDGADDVMMFRSLGHNRVSRIEVGAWQFCQRLVDLYVGCSLLKRCSPFLCMLTKCVMLVKKVKERKGRVFI